MSMPMICITSDSNRGTPSGELLRQLVSPAAYSAAIAAAGGLPVIAGERCAEELARRCDALLLSGGDDLEPHWFGEKVLNSSVVTDPLRDGFEMELCRLFLANGKPILTICRGFQLLNVALGGDLWQDLAEQQGYIHSDQRIRHLCMAEENSVLARLFGREFRVNSTHHQAVRRLGEGLRVTGRSVEGIVEAYEHESRPILGTQFHPERLTGAQWDGRTPDFAPYFAHFVGMVEAHMAGR